MSLLLQSPAMAEGGQTIASAPAVQFGVQEFGNTQSGGAPGPACASDNKSEYWTLTAISGDRFTIDWESSADDSLELNIYPPGTTDFNVDQSDAYDNYELNSNGKAESMYAANRDGSYVLEFDSCDGGDGGGPYDFTVFVKHALVVGLPRLSKIKPDGAIKVAVHTTDGSGVASGPAVALQARSVGGGKWQKIGSGAVHNSTAEVKYTVPVALRNRNVKIRAIATGNNYQTTTSEPETVHTS